MASEHKEEADVWRLMLRAAGPEREVLTAVSDMKEAGAKPRHLLLLSSYDEKKQAVWENDGIARRTHADLICQSTDSLFTCAAPVLLAQVCAIQGCAAVDSLVSIDQAAKVLSLARGQHVQNRRLYLGSKVLSAQFATVLEFASEERFRWIAFSLSTLGLVWSPAAQPGIQRLLECKDLHDLDLRISCTAPLDLVSKGPQLRTVLTGKAERTECLFPTFVHTLFDDDLVARMNEAWK